MRRFGSFCTVVALAIASWSPAAAAAKAPDSAWERWPTNAEWRDALAKGLKANQFVRAIMRCAVEDSGELSRCRTISETPRGSGVGDTLLALAPKFRRKPPGERDPRQVDISNGDANLDKRADWLRRPTQADLRTVFPVEAYKRGISGSATISCVATVQGALTDCITADEYPADLAFGGAAIALTPQFLMKPAMLDGAPVPSIVQIPINFILSGPAPMGDSKRVAPPNLAWTEAPSYADVVAAYPAKARAERIGGRATVACAMTREGRLTDCQVINSSPRSYGFDAAAKALARKFRLEVVTPADADAARKLMVHLPMTFDPAMLNPATAVVGKPNWASLPKADQILAAFEALKTTSVVRVQLKCVVQPAGYVGQCVAVSESPVGIGVGAAALSLTPSFRLTTWTAEGLPTVGGSVTIPIRYEPEAATASPPPAGH